MSMTPSGPDPASDLDWALDSLRLIEEYSMPLDLVLVAASLSETVQDLNAALWAIGRLAEITGAQGG